MSDSKRPPIYFWMFVIFALIWNLLGVYQFYYILTISPATLSEMPPEEAALYNVIPAWVMVAFAVAVFGGTLGCVTLLWKKALAYYFLLASLMGIVIQMFHNLVLSDMMDVYGPGGLVMPIMVIIVGIALVWITEKAKKKEWIS